jgi:hypothetical protein
VQKFGALNVEDTSHCKRILNDYHDQQTQLVAKNKGLPDPKIYPLPFNAYNLDESSKTSANQGLPKNGSAAKDGELRDVKGLTNDFDKLLVNSKQKTSSPTLQNEPQCTQQVKNDDLNVFFK